MGRAGHLSHKVPNVKLRPAPAPQPVVPPPRQKHFKRKVPTPADQDAQVKDGAEAEEGVDEFDAVAQASREKKPLEGKTVCLTGLRDRRVSQLLLSVLSSSC